MAGLVSFFQCLQPGLDSLRFGPEGWGFSVLCLESGA